MPPGLSPPLSSASVPDTQHHALPCGRGPHHVTCHGTTSRDHWSSLFLSFCARLAREPQARAHAAFGAAHGFGHPLGGLGRTRPGRGGRPCIYTNTHAARRAHRYKHSLGSSLIPGTDKRRDLQLGGNTAAPHSAPGSRAPCPPRPAARAPRPASLLTSPRGLCSPGTTACWDHLRRAESSRSQVTLSDLEFGWIPGKAIGAPL